MKKLTIQLILLLAFYILALGLQSCNEKPKEKEEKGTMPKTEMTTNQLNMSTSEIYGVELEYDFKDFVIIDLTYGSDSELYWIERESKAYANEEINTIHLNEHTIIIGWNDSYGNKVSLYSDFAAGQTYGYEFYSDGKIRTLMGTIKIKN